MKLLETEIRGEPKSVPEIVREASELRAETIARIRQIIAAATLSGDRTNCPPDAMRN